MTKDRQRVLDELNADREPEVPASRWAFLAFGVIIGVVLSYLLR